MNLGLSRAVGRSNVQQGNIYTEKRGSCNNYRVLSVCVLGNMV